MSSNVPTMRRIPKRNALGQSDVSHGLSRSKVYRVWQSIKQRCFDPTLKNYHNYGGRGITLAPEWVHDPAAFIEYMGPRPSSKHSIDRIDNNRGYVPGNLRWATTSEQRRNMRTNKIVAEDIPFIKHWASIGFTQNQIGAAFGVDGSHICRIKSGEQWAMAPALKGVERKGVPHI